MSKERVLWAQFSADPRTADHGVLRASDRDRELVLEVLRDAFSDGRLDQPEFDVRTQAGLAATTLDQCRDLVADLVRGAASAHLKASRSTHRQGRHPALPTLPALPATTTYTRSAISAALAPLLMYAIVRTLGGMSGGWQPPAMFWILTAVLAVHAAGALVATQVANRLRPKLT